jgi:hypothetical protein
VERVFFGSAAIPSADGAEIAEALFVPGEGVQVDGRKMRVASISPLTPALFVSSTALFS